MTFTITSTAFGNGQKIPTQYTGDGKDVSPPLAWNNTPSGTKEFALICDDPDAPTPEPWVHWVIYGIPVNVTSLPEGVPPIQKPAAPAGAAQGKNSWKNAVGYRGPAPPPGHGTHHYHFRLYAVDSRLSLAPGLNKQQLLKALDGHVLAETELVGIYER